jgi:hypothetical protein
MCHLMFDILALAADQIPRLITYRANGSQNRIKIGRPWSRRA